FLRTQKKPACAGFFVSDEMRWSAGTGKLELTPGFIHNQCRGIRQVQASAVRLHGHPQPMAVAKTVPHIGRQPTGFGPEHQVITLLKRHLMVVARALGSQPEQALRFFGFKKALVISVYLYRRVLAVIQPRPAHLLVFQRESQGFDQMQAAAGVGAEPDDIAGVRRYFRLIEYNVQHAGQRSTARATPIPPPMHRVARPFLASRRTISCSRVTSMRQPDAPIGWPMAMAPPFTFTLAVSQPMSRLTEMAWAANASLASMRSRSAAVQPARSRQRWLAGIGPVPMMVGSTPALAWALMVASGVRPSCFAFSALHTMTAAAPSFREEALPAVTEPSFLKAGRSLPRLSPVTPSRGHSSLSTISGSPLRWGMLTGTI